MTIYEIRYIDEGHGDGFGRQYRTSRRAAEKLRAGIESDYREACTRFDTAVANGTGFYDLPVNPGVDPEAEIIVLSFTGTPQQMVLQALEHNA